MNTKSTLPTRIDTIGELYRLLDLSGQLHPLISIFDNTQVVASQQNLPKAFLFDFYQISYKKRLKGRSGYGQSHYDFDDGTMVFTAPGQLISTETDTEYYGISLLVHADFLAGYPLARHIRQFGFFGYDSNEALHLSDSEKQTMLSVLGNIESELRHGIDDFSQDIIVSQLETLLNYSNRFYRRQFTTRKLMNSDLLAKLETALNQHFTNQKLKGAELPTVEWLAAQVNVSPRYLSDLLRSLTGQNAQQLIHEKLIEKGSELLSSTSMSVAEIAYELGFEYAQSFSKLFKKKTNLTPVQYRQGFHQN